MFTKFSVLVALCVTYVSALRIVASPGAYVGQDPYPVGIYGEAGDPHYVDLSLVSEQGGPVYPVAQNVKVPDNTHFGSVDVKIPDVSLSSNPYQFIATKPNDPYGPPIAKSEPIAIAPTNP